jgi:arylsulfatase A-like enzyme
MKRPYLVLAFIICASQLSFRANAINNETKKQPNIVFLLADDLGWTSLSCFGSEFYETPNIDRLAKEGMRFDHGYSTMMNCTPSRASIMSGQYTSRNKVYNVINFQERILKKGGNLNNYKLLQPSLIKTLSNDISTMAESLKKAGYTTGMYGKWHLGSNDQHPSNRGFDEAIESHGKHFNFKTDPPIEHDSSQYLSDFLGDRAIDFIERHSKSDKPFFLYLPDYLVHKPLEAKQEYLEYFASKEPSELQKSAIAAAMIKSLDETVGRVLDKLDELNIAEETFVIFTSDNGGLGYEEDGRRLENTSNYPLRLFKGFEFEGGIRVPYIFRWPGKIPANTLNQENIINIDLYPTLLAIAGASSPSQPLDGVDLNPILKDPNARLEPRELFFYMPFYSSFNRPSIGVRRGDWKLIHLFDSGENELFHTGDDINEAKDISSQNPEIVKELKDIAFKWMDETDAPRMTINPDYMPQNP